MITQNSTPFIYVMDSLPTPLNYFSSSCTLMWGKHILLFTSLDASPCLTTALDLLSYRCLLPPRAQRPTCWPRTWANSLKFFSEWKEGVSDHPTRHTRVLTCDGHPHIYPHSQIYKYIVEVYTSTIFTFLILYSRDESLLPLSKNNLWG